jgi:hypothetical protein
MLSRKIPRQLISSVKKPPTNGPRPVAGDQEGGEREHVAADHPLQVGDRDAEVERHPRQRQVEREEVELDHEHRHRGGDQDAGQPLLLMRRQVSIGHARSLSG